MSRAISVCFALQAVVATAGAAENLALHKPYVLAPAPSYKVSTDPGDATQLTDGEAKGSNWSNKSTVGWHWPSDAPQITIDLGQVSFIERVEIHTAAGTRGGVKMWRYAVVLLSRDGADYQLAGMGRVPEEVRQAALREKMIEPVIGVGGINANGRFVKILIQQENPSFFTDEIKVLGSPQVNDGVSDLPLHIRSDYTFQTFQAVEKRVEVGQAIQATQQAVAAVRQKLSPERVNELTTKLHSLQEACREKELARISDAVLQQARAALGRMRASLYRDLYGAGLVVLPADGTRQLTQTEVVTGQPQAAPAEVSLWQREVGSLAFNLINCTAEPVSLRISTSPATAEGVQVKPEEVFTLRRAAFVYGVGQGEIADVLTLQGGTPFVLEPGWVQQVWVTVNTAKLAPGDYTSSLQVSAFQGSEAAVAQAAPLRIRVQPLKMPDHLSFNGLVWCYPHVSDVTRGSLRETVADLQSHGINVFAIHSENLPFPRTPGSAGDVLSDRACAKLDELLDANRDTRMFIVLLGSQITMKGKSVFGNYMTGPWKENARNWLVQLIAHLKQKGAGYDRLIFAPYDEYIGEDFLSLAQVIREADPRVRIWANSYGGGPSDFKKARPLVDIWCFPKEMSEQHPDWMAAVKAYDCGFWCYRAMNRADKPFEDYRKLPWWAFRNRLTGGGFWTYADAGRPLWDDYGRAMGNYGVVYGGYDARAEVRSEAIVPSRRWEMWREGVQDYEYLRELRNRITKVQAADPGKAEGLQHRLDQWVDQMLAGDSATCFAIRGQITRTILELDNPSR